MLCQKRELLWVAYSGAVSAFVARAEELAKDHSGAPFWEKSKKSQKAKILCRTSHAAFLLHIDKHGCGKV